MKYLKMKYLLCKPEKKKVTYPKAREDITWEAFLIKMKSVIVFDRYLNKYLIKEMRESVAGCTLIVTSHVHEFKLGKERKAVRL